MLGGCGVNAVWIRYSRLSKCFNECKPKNPVLPGKRQDAKRVHVVGIDGAYIFKFGKKCGVSLVHASIT